jgi:hypothetical protein
VTCRLVYRHAPAGYLPAGLRMSLFLDIGTGAGLAGASGVRPFLPALAAGALARGDVGVDFEGTGWSFLEAPGFLAAVVVLALVAYGAERRSPETAGGRSPLAGALLAAGMTLGALLFAGTLADGGHAVVIGLLAGPPCALLAWLAVGGLVERARRRLDAGAARLLSVYADAGALLLAVIAVLLPPASFLALAGFALLLVGGRRREGGKYAGLRVLR